MENYGGYDVTKLKYLGKGVHGKVYKIDSKKCIKVFYEERICKYEVESLLVAQKNPHFPKIYNWGDKYIIRECIEGITLSKYLKKHPLTLELSGKILNLYESLKEVGFTRLDTVLFHIFIVDDFSLRMIDTAISTKLTAIYPSLMLRGLRKLGYKREFLKHVKMLKPELYELWMKEIKRTI